MRVVRLRHKLTYCFFPFSWVDQPIRGGGGGATNPEPGIIYVTLYPMTKNTQDRVRFQSSAEASRSNQMHCSYSLQAQLT